MTWTTRKPTQAGVYLWRRYKKKKSYKVEIRKRRGALCGDQFLEVWWDGEMVARFDQPVDGEWSSEPIKEPGEE